MASSSVKVLGLGEVESEEKGGGEKEEQTAGMENKRNKEDGEEDESLGYLPERPEEPLASDCCGTGCSPCVRDIFEAELEEWRRLKAMTPRERAEWRRAKMKGTRREGEEGNLTALSAISPAQYQNFTVEKVQQLSHDSHMFSFKLPPGHTLGLDVGQHIILR